MRFCLRTPNVRTENICLITGSPYIHVIRREKGVNEEGKGGRGGSTDGMGLERAVSGRGKYVSTGKHARLSSYPIDPNVRQSRHFVLVSNKLFRCY